MNVLYIDDCLVGTGSYEADHITRVFVEPVFQGQGYGHYIMYYQKRKLDDWIQKFLRAEVGDMPNPNFALADGLLLEDREYFCPQASSLGDAFLHFRELCHNVAVHQLRIASQFF